MLYFLIGCLTTGIILAIIKLTKKRIHMKRIVFRQSTLYRIIKDFIPEQAMPKNIKNTQLSIHSRTGKIKFVEAPDHRAYWIDNNVFYSAAIVNGEFDPSTATPVDTINASKNKIKELLLILDSLRNG